MAACRPASRAGFNAGCDAFRTRCCDARLEFQKRRGSLPALLSLPHQLALKHRDIRHPPAWPRSHRRRILPRRSATPYSVMTISRRWRGMVSVARSSSGCSRASPAPACREDSHGENRPRTLPQRECPAPRKLYWPPTPPHPPWPFSRPSEITAPIKVAIMALLTKRAIDPWRGACRLHRHKARW